MVKPRKLFKAETKASFERHELVVWALDRRSVILYMRLATN